jgi:formylmethanofuran--tetrahydromethanopterin N-formyltransferase
MAVNGNEAATKSGAAGESARGFSANGIRIDASFAEAFAMRATALVVTADTPEWAEIAAQSLTGFATSIIACGVEAGIDERLSPEATPDGRPGVRVLLFASSTSELQKQLQNRVGQCVLTAPSAACYAGLAYQAGAERLRLGDALRYFGDGFQIAKRFGGRRFWRVPVMEGEFVCEAETGLTKEAVGGGNLLIMGPDPAATRRAAERAAAAMRAIPGVILPFPGGIVRSGSKVGSKYKGLIASTNHAYCPSLRGVVESALDPDIGAVLEIVIDGLTEQAVAEAMRAGLAALIAAGPEGGCLRIGAGNYGGKLGKFHFHLADLLPPEVPIQTLPPIQSLPSESDAR